MEHEANQEGSGLRHGKMPGRPSTPGGLWVPCQCKRKEKLGVLKQLSFREAVRPDLMSDPCMGVPHRPQSCEGLLGLRPRQEGVRLRTGALRSVWDPKMMIAWADQKFEGQQRLIFRVLKLCPTLSKISGLGSTVRDPTLTQATQPPSSPAPSSSYLELVAVGRLRGESGSVGLGTRTGLSSPSRQVLPRGISSSASGRETEPWPVSSPSSPPLRPGNLEGGARGSGFQ